MRKVLYALGVVALFAGGCSQERFVPSSNENNPEDLSAGQIHLSTAGDVVVANRGSGSISVIDHQTHEVETYMLPAEEGEPIPEPMYVVYVGRTQRVFVGDRANDRVAVFEAGSYDVVGTVPAGEGVFHMWADPQGRQLWVNNDIENTTTVIDPMSLQVITTVPTPADLVEMGGKPHDVIVGPHGRLAYVSVLGVSGDDDYIVQYDMGTYQETGRAPVGKDPHVSLAFQHDYLFVPCQNSNVVVVLDRFSMEEEARIDVPGAHGAWHARDGRKFYTANLPGGGSEALFTIDTEDFTVVGDGVDAPYAVPHNIVTNSADTKLFLSHSGASSDKVTIFSIDGSDGRPMYLDEVTVGLNPFGIAFAG
ncbi:MAG: beta-propeller fold lactonase family protein [Candidatus Eisenbacteria bacterium]|nr:beta-propeller fold lactonase family protein [Candidatus Latescibacterota bacterium]MBD3301855.1 beta-propeller fold lactonase family protein [Candidatus Eisenbacteria bacterium]